MGRIAEIRRKTKETDIALRINLDGKGKASIKTGIGFLNHMLELFAYHGLFDL
ncbi:MAG: imidazoleglycerol-phosphate dehydratase, partial [Candidatus Omnitrophica bacterium]|nr:imidazoleglycerol-phosphate dehydratase [Candidatus Omnitrophota bacterium]